MKSPIPQATYQAVRMLRSADPRKVGAVVRWMRTHGGLTQQALADALGLHRVSIANIEAGKHVVSHADLMKIAKATNNTMVLLVIPNEVIRQ